MGTSRARGESHRGWAGRLSAALALALVLAGGGLGAAPKEDPVVVTGEIASLTLDRTDDAAPGATVVVDGVRVILPTGLQIDLPAAATTLVGLFRDAPAACLARGESGLAKADACRTEIDRASGAAPPDRPMRDGQPDPDSEPGVLRMMPPARATIDIVRTDDGRTVATSMRVTGNLEQLMGGVTFINADEGYIRINGYYREDFGGTLVRINDPNRQHSDQSGTACGGEGNCSPDARFRVGVATYSVRFERGNPACIGGDDQGCYESDRKVAADDRLSRIPILVGDNVAVDGSFEVIRGVRFFSAQSMIVQANLTGEK